MTTKKLAGNYPTTATFRTACIIPTYNGERHLHQLLDSIYNQSLKVYALIVDSNSTDGTIDIIKSRCDEFISIPSSDFNHGGTRQLMVERNPEYDIYVFLTQDAYLEDPHALEKIVAPFADPKVGAVCGRQLPHLDANPLASHARAFNYPATSQVKTMADASELGIKTAFMSNSFAAYRKEALLEAGGFPEHVILSEDMYVTAKMLMVGWKVAYASDACCRHSHNYTLAEEFRRYFDQGVFHSREPWIRKTFGGAGGEGFRYVKSELKFLGLSRIYLWPSSLVRNACKLIAYKLGQQEKYIPVELKKKLSMHKRFWDRPYAVVKP